MTNRTTMCKGGKCKFKNTCRRFLEFNENKHMWFTVPPVKNGSCRYLILKGVK